MHMAQNFCREAWRKVTTWKTKA